jgi:hypothetical protein
MEALGFNQALAHQAETTLPTKLGGMLLSRLLHSGGRGKDVQLAVGEDTVYVKEKQCDFLGASLWGIVFLGIAGSLAFERHGRVIHRILA